MKSPKTKFVVISTIGLASIVGIFACAQWPVPHTGQEVPVYLVIRCVGVNKGKIMAALKDRPLDTYRFRYEADLPVGNLDNTSPPSCDAHLVGNATQKARFATTTELRAFMDKAWPAP
jgi:hypothetical protein